MSDFDSSFPDDDYWAVEEDVTEVQQTTSQASNTNPRLKVLIVSVVGFILILAVFAAAVLFLNWKSEPSTTPQSAEQTHSTEKMLPQHSTTPASPQSVDPQLTTSQSIPQSGSTVQVSPQPTDQPAPQPTNSPAPTPIQPTQVNIDPTKLNFGNLQTETFIVMDKRVVATPEGTLEYTLYVSSQQVQNKPYVVLKSVYDSYDVTSTLQLSYRVDSDGRVSFVR